MCSWPILCSGLLTHIYIVVNWMSRLFGCVWAFIYKRWMYANFVSDRTGDNNLHMLCSVCKQSSFFSIKGNMKSLSIPFHQNWQTCKSTSNFLSGRVNPKRIILICVVRKRKYAFSSCRWMNVHLSAKILYSNMIINFQPLFK